jgi:hypothetical protein
MPENEKEKKERRTYSPKCLSSQKFMLDATNYFAELV